VTVREYIEALLGNCKEHCRDKFLDIYNTMEILFESQEKALKMANKELDAKFLTIKEAETRYGAKLNELEKSLVEVSIKKSEISGKVFMIIAVVSAVIGAIVGHFIK